MNPNRMLSTAGKIAGLLHESGSTCEEAEYALRLVLKEKQSANVVDPSFEEVPAPACIPAQDHRHREAWEWLAQNAVGLYWSQKQWWVSGPTGNCKHGAGSPFDAVRRAMTHGFPKQEQPEPLPPKYDLLGWLGFHEGDVVFCPSTNNFCARIRMPNGETWTECRLRIDAAIKGLKDRYEAVEIPF